MGRNDFSMNELWCREHGEHNNNICTGKNDRVALIWAYERGILPEHNVFQKSKKNGSVHGSGWVTWVRMGAVGCICTGGRGNKWERGKNSLSVQFLQI